MKKLLLLICFITIPSVFSQTVWNEVPTGFLTAATGTARISYADVNNVWFYATDGSGAQENYQQWAKSTDSGSTWTVGEIVLPTIDHIVGDICATSATTAYVSCWANTAAVFGGIWKTTDGGVSWSQQTTALYNSGTDSFANIVHFFDQNNGLTMGDPTGIGAGRYFEIYTTSNAGALWSRVPATNIPAPLSGEYGYVHNSCSFGNILWFGTNKGRLYKSIDKGLNWTVSQSPSLDFGSATSSAVYDFKNATDGLLILRNFDFYRTTDGGTTWTQEFPAKNYNRFDISFVRGTANTYVTYGAKFQAVPTTNPPRGSAFSTDGGLNWIDINGIDIVPNNGAGDLTFFDATHGLAAGFTTDEVTGGIWKWVTDANNLNNLNNVSYTSDKLFVLAPNPNNGRFSVSGKNLVTIELTDVLGKSVFTKNINELSADINISDFNAGVYMVKVTNNEGKSSVVKVVKQ